jgi:hypothetical protein
MSKAYHFGATESSILLPYFGVPLGHTRHRQRSSGSSSISGISILLGSETPEIPRNRRDPLKTFIAISAFGIEMNTGITESVVTGVR